MWSMRPAQIRELCRMARFADRECRSDLARGFIVSENDYTSNFTAAFRRNINAHSRTGLVAHSQLLAPADERSTGCDAIIVVSTDGQFKIAAFEAKHPRFSQPNYHWDHPQTATGLSHFSDQLQRQAGISATVAVFEMFYCDLGFHQQASHLHPFGSSCVWHQHALNVDQLRGSNQPWTRTELDTLLRHNVGIGTILRDLCACRVGRPGRWWGGAESIAREFGLSGLLLHIDAEAADDVDDDAWDPRDDMERDDDDFGDDD